MNQESRVASVALLSAVIFAGPCWAWGPAVHEVVTTKAIDTLPGGLQPFYKTHRFEIPSLGPEATHEEEGQERRFAVDALLSFPFADLPGTEKAAQERFPGNPALSGRLPWLIHESYGRLVEAFKKKDKTAILKESDTISALVADLHNPLALSQNFDGQKTDQLGIFVRFSVKFPEFEAKRVKPSPDAARFLDSPQNYVGAMIRATYIWLDNLLYADDLAHRGKGGYGELYYEELAIRAGDILKGCLSRAASDVGSYWYTAWTAAGRPELK